MTAVLARGANIAVADRAVDVVVAWRAGAAVDSCALLVTAAGTVRGDDDFVFYNQPRDGSGAVRLTADGQGSATLAVDLGRIPADIDRVVIAGSMESGTFDTVPGLQLTVTGGRGRRIANFPLVNVEAVAAVVFGELYRRGGGWKFRAVGQGWDSGLAGLVTHYGVAVEEEPPARGGGAVPTQLTASRATARPSTAAPSRTATPPAARRGARKATPAATRSVPPTATPAQPRTATPAQAATPARTATPAQPRKATPARTATPAHSRTATPAQTGTPAARRPAAGSPAPASPPTAAASPAPPTGANPTPTRPTAPTPQGATGPASPTPAGPAAPTRTTPTTPRPDWYPAPDNPSLLRWWTGTEWSTQSLPLAHDTPTTCGRCTRPKRRPVLSGVASCPSCEAEIANTLTVWRTRAAQVLASSGVSGPEWDALWAELRYYRVREEHGRSALRPLALHHLHRLLTFAFADDVVEQHEVDGFDEAVRQLGVADPAITGMRQRLQRGLELSLISNGNLPHVTRTTLNIDADETLHLEVPAVHVRQLASGPRRSNGRLIATNAKLRFVGDAGGSVLAWGKVLEARAEYANVVVSATTARGGGSYEVSDPEYVAAVLTGVLKVAKRLAATPQQRATRAIPPGIRAEVWRRDGGACVDCSATEYLEFDHVIPWSRGGATSAGNLQLLCRRCNLAKGARI